MREERIAPQNVDDAVQMIIPYLEDTANTANMSIYYDGWRGLAASVVLRTIAKEPPASLLKKFDKIIHVDCSRWKSRRALQRTIAQELKLPRRVMDIFYKQDEEDDYRGIDEDSRAEIGSAGKEIFHALMGHTCLVIFHNGSSDMVNLNDYGILQGKLFDTKVLWTFRGRLRLNPGISKKVDDSHLSIYSGDLGYKWNLLLKKEARETVGHTDKLDEAIEECCLYLLSLNSQGGNIMDYNWTTHASNYWVCDGIMQGNQCDEAWEVAAALHQKINMEDYLSNALPSFGHELETPSKRWILSRDSSVVHPKSTSFFLVPDASESDHPLKLLPNDMFHQSENLHVLKLFRCTFNFSSPPFHCCHNIRFLGLDSCQDLQPGQDKKQDTPTVDFFKSLWVIDICNTDWDFPSSSDIIEHVARNIREVHIKNGRFWNIVFAWGQLQNLRKLHVIDPTYSWVTGEKDEFTILPSLSGSTILKALVLDGCVCLELVEGLPPSLESFSLDARAARPRTDDYKEAKIRRISLAGCARLCDFTLKGSLPNLKELDLSVTRVHTLDLTTQVVQVPSLQQIILLGCMQLHAILWPREGLPALKVLHIDTSVFHVQTKLHDVYVTVMDMRFCQSLVLRNNARFCWKGDGFHLNLCVPYTTNAKGQRYMKEKMGPGNSLKIMGPPQPKSLTPDTYNTYMDVFVGNVIVDHDYHNGMQFQPSDCHVEIAKGVSNIKVDSEQAIEALIFLMDNLQSLYVHDNSSITGVIHEHTASIGEMEFDWGHLKQCQVVRCPKMHTVFSPNYNRIYPFKAIETFWAADLLNAHCIWGKGRSYSGTDNISFVKLKSIHLYSCPRITFVLPLLMAIQGSYLRNLGSLHIVKCGDLKMVFPVHTGIRLGVLEFPSLKHMHLYELYKLQHICEVKMLAPKLERVWLRGCWALRRLPAIGRDSCRPVVECEKDWWEKLEWDGLEVGHHPSLFEPCHSSYYKMPLKRVSVLR